MAQEIQFYSTSEPYEEFSNFAAYPVQLKKRTWPTTEHYFQAQKFAGQPAEDTIRKARSPMEAARLGRSRKLKPLPNWDAIRDGVMLDALRAKFTQHPELRELLISTGDAKLIEHTESDDYWGDGGDGSGKNRLGILLMRVRQELKS